ncbi:Aim39p NDAI_0E00450 [Naumovozyma dairenensis CBS 421]|uniref:Altered inheritance of mitochondria protein 39, mitochondrial n=1 Tax=Naumovozyma dairenensis (strain ATCC 10597 / BCRC 20456 / CBS 421 / NBRC 0211 / NRRL Y-12639) TaxID=1071378 RepID=G0WAU1_NAUDC|nr:hypothetical protein NDAI_0E00450 [Naumovozyma dairenensis CBS 421]CCD24861.1 hypothetical protein NDAI_0E00450 [Naumovozyma dairenensis CBS 421]
MIYPLISRRTLVTSSPKGIIIRLQYPILRPLTFPLGPNHVNNTTNCNGISITKRNYSLKFPYFDLKNTKLRLNTNNNVRMHENNKQVDGKHFFTKQGDVTENNEKSQLKHENPSHEEDEKVMAINSIQEAIRQQRNKRRKQMASIIFMILSSLLIGYGLGYKVLYLRQEIFWPICPTSKYHKLSKNELKKINLLQIEKLARIRTLEQLSKHEMIKDQYGIPLKLENEDNTEGVGEPFKIWCEDQDLCLFGVKIKPDGNNNNNKQKQRDEDHKWYRLPFLFKWRFTYKSISLLITFQNILNSIGINKNGLYEIIEPEKVYGSFKYEHPLGRGSSSVNDNKSDCGHPMHLWFLGEIKLDKDSLVIYKGKYHVDVKMQEITLLRKENGKLIEYILYNDIKR